MSESTTTTSSRPKKILVINGPNLNLLGTREPSIYGSTTLSQIESSLVSRGAALHIEVQTYQSNHEGAIVDRIHQAAAPFVPLEDRVDGIILNPAAFTHTSVAIRDALLGVNVPFVECHISNVHARESWRSHSYFSDKAVAVVMGMGVYGYVAALEWWAWRFQDGMAKGI